jgi:hypothetical protein
MDPRPHPSDAAIADEILRQVAARGADRSICPSEGARALAPAWHPLMAPVRRVAAGLAGANRIDILRKGKVIDPASIKGVIRLRAKPAGPTSNG